MDNFSLRVQHLVRRIADSDDRLRQEFEEVRADPAFQEDAVRLKANFSEVFSRPEGGMEGRRVNSALETIVLRQGRPVLAIQKDKTVAHFRDASSVTWRTILSEAEPTLTPAIQSVGRIEVKHHPDGYSWLGTGWLVGDDVIVTNRHVAETFGRNSPTGFVFKQGQGQPSMEAGIDFLEELDRPEEFTCQIKRILHIENENGPDIAFLQIKPNREGLLRQPIVLGDGKFRVNQKVAVIGYPAMDSRILDPQLMIDIFGNVYDKKRLAPGEITKITETEILHDCSTLGGNSGSVVLDLKTGEAVGLHFAGVYLQANYAVPSNIINETLHFITKGSMPKHVSHSGADAAPPIVSAPLEVPVSDSQPRSPEISFTLPIHFSIRVDATIPNIGTPSNGRHDLKPYSVATIEDEIYTEGKPEDYAGRTGYDSSFLGEDFEVPLPNVTNARLKADILTFNVNGEQEHVLKYQHFSVVMSSTRRLCLFSAVNINGKSSKGMKRVGWRLDPRIPASAQIIKECYGEYPKFSRGHMTRREDPIWGSEEEARLGNADSMHVTNAVPQLQSNNAGVWLRLENYALDNAREDDMRISVFTGPVLRIEDQSDEISEDVKYPEAFWKVIVFIHDKTKKLCATGYLISQQESLKQRQQDIRNGGVRNNEYVFGPHGGSQVPIVRIEQLTGLSFGQLSKLDPLASNLELPQIALTEPAQIQFLPR